MNIYKKLNITMLLVFMASILGCKENFLDTDPQGSLNSVTLATEDGVNALLIAAYSSLNGQLSGQDIWTSDLSNWVYGDIASDDALKGSEAADQTEITQIETWANLTAGNGYVNGKWVAVYEGVTRTNDVLRVLQSVTDIEQSAANVLQAEARFLRGHFHFEAKRTWNMVPYIDETVSDFRVKNDRDIWADIEADFQFAVDNLPDTQTEVGRATKGAAQAYLAKVHLYQSEYGAAKLLLDAVISSGRYTLAPNYQDNFDFQTDNNSESIFQIQASASEPGADNNANWGRVLNGFLGGPLGCCGFLASSQNFVNAHRTDANGLPFLDTFDDVSISGDAAVVAVDNPRVDPRLDWTVAREGVPLLDHGVMQRAWVRDPAYAGLFVVKKFLPSAVQHGQFGLDPFFGNGVTNYSILRYADVLLMRAEVAAVEGDLATALTYVNQIRNRAKNGSVVTHTGGTPAANYVVEPYTTFTSADQALKAVKFERRLELGMEGQRLFDLVRWGDAVDVMTTYFNSESTRRGYLSTASFTADNQYYPIPTTQIDLSASEGQPTLVQNQGY